MLTDCLLCILQLIFCRSSAGFEIFRNNTLYILFKIEFDSGLIFYCTYHLLFFPLVFSKSHEVSSYLYYKILNSYQIKGSHGE